MRHFCRLMPMMAFGILLIAASIAAADGPGPGALLAAAKPGQTVTLPAGTFTTVGLVIPPGVSLRGAGYARTTIAVTGQVGISIDGGSQSTISDLTVSDAVNTGVLVTHSTGVTVSRVRALRCLSGVMVSDSAKVRIENVVAAENRTGIALNNCSLSSVANCTVAQNTALGISLGINPNCAVFNSLIVNSPIGVYVSPANTTLALDNNFYLVNSVGKCNDILMPNVFVWRDSTGYDHHSVSMSVAFAGDEPYTYRATTTLSWAQDRSVTSGWGAPKIGTFTSPDRDIDGQAYLYGPCVGAWEVAATPSRTPDGTFTISTSDGTKSAGLYTKAGKHVAWLFSNLPLKRDTYNFWLPSRDWQGAPISSGDYELRIAEADLALKAVGSGIGGNTGVGSTKDGLAQISNHQIIYDSKNRPVVDMGWSESGMSVRAFPAGPGSQRWSFPGPTTDMGIASDGRGSLYILQMKGKQPALVYLNEDTGTTTAFGDGQYNRYFPEGTFSDKVGGMAILGKTLYVADTKNNALRSLPLADPSFGPGTTVTSPSSPCADAQRNLVWLLSAHSTIIAIDPSGATKYQFACPVPGAQSIAVSGNRLAILSYATGKVHVYDCTDPNHLSLIRAIGTGDGPAGPMQADRFAFKGADVGDGALPRVALNSDGVVGVVDNYGIKEFAADGTVMRDLIGGWFNSFHLGLPNAAGAMRVLDLSTPRSFLIDAKTKTSRPEGTWSIPGAPISMFDVHGKHYGLYGGSLPAHEPNAVFSAVGAPYNRTYMCIAALDENTFVATPLIAYSWQSETTVLTNFKASVNAPMEQNPWTPLLGSDGKPFNFINGAQPFCQPNGDLVFNLGRGFTTYPLLSIDRNGVPQYDFGHPKVITLTVGADDTFTSPYDFKTKESVFAQPPNQVSSFMSDGGFAKAISLHTGRMEALTGNWAGTDLACFNSDGKLRWFQPMTEVNGVVGAYAVGNTIYGMHITTSETEVFSSDGLYLGRLGQPRGLPWGGKWLDNGFQYHPYLGNDGKQYMVYGDFNECCFYWMSVDGLDAVKRSQIAIHLDDAHAALLAGQPLPEFPKPVALPVTKIKIAKLSAPMTIDGSLDKWRVAVPTPQVIMTPESGSPAIKGPDDCSAVIRFAHENGNLYVQVIKFDNVIVLDNPLDTFYRQDGVEMTINSYASGFKFNVTRVKDLGDIIYRDRFYNVPPAKLLDPVKAPRKITIYDNARDFPERKLIENLYGIDMSACKVMVTEFKVPLNAETYENDPAAVPPSTSGSTMWIGVLLDDNDVHASDVQNYELWPSTYGTFSSKESGALATFE